MRNFRLFFIPYFQNAVSFILWAHFNLNNSRSQYSEATCGLGSHIDPMYSLNTIPLMNALELTYLEPLP